MEASGSLLSAAFEDSSIENSLVGGLGSAMEPFIGAGAGNDLDTSRLSRLSLPSDADRRDAPRLSLGDTGRLSLGASSSSRQLKMDLDASARTSATKEQLLDLREQLRGRIAGCRPQSERPSVVPVVEHEASESVGREASQSERCIFDNGPPSDRNHFEVALKNVEHSVTEWAQWVKLQLDDVRAEVRTQIRQQREISSAAVAELRRDLDVHDELGQQITEIRHESRQFKASLADVAREIALLRERFQLRDSVEESMATLRSSLDRQSSQVAKRLRALEASSKAMSSSSSAVVGSGELASVKDSIEAARADHNRESLQVGTRLDQLEASLRDTVRELSEGPAASQMHARSLATDAGYLSTGVEELRDVNSLVAKLENRLANLEDASVRSETPESEELTRVKEPCKVSILERLLGCTVETVLEESPDVVRQDLRTDLGHEVAAQRLGSDGAAFDLCGALLLDPHEPRLGVLHAKVAHASQGILRIDAERESLQVAKRLQELEASPTELVRELTAELHARTHVIM